MSDGDDDRWHVRLAPGEVKVLTLEQVDDLFRLDMIDGDTLLRQEGTEQWLPLRVVAGLDDDEVEAPQPALPPPVAKSAAPPPTRSVPPPSVRSAPPPPPAPLPPPGERAPFAPSPSFVPPPASTSAPPRAVPSAPPPPPRPIPSAPPPPRPIPSAPPPSLAPPSSFAPAPVAALPLSAPLPLPAPRGSRAETVLIGLAVLLGLVVTLHRNGVLAQAFASAGQAGTYAKLEAALGGPGFGTQRAVDALIEKSR